MEEENQEGMEELSVEDNAELANDKVDALVNLLVKKGLITEEEFDKEYENLWEDETTE